MSERASVHAWREEEEGYGDGGMVKENLDSLFSLCLWNV